jgi:SAM-dependent methyltransferase
MRKGIDYQGIAGMSLRAIWLRRYFDDELAREYDWRHGELAAGELEWYLKYARKTGGPVLELACGTGRLLIPIAQAGYQIHGVDLSGAMLRLLKSKINGLDPDARRRIRLCRGDMLRFSPPIRYPLAILAYNSLQELETQADYGLFFKNIHACLRAGGYFLLMVARPDPWRYGDGKDYVVDCFDRPAVNGESGTTVSSRSVSRLDAEARRIVLHMTFVIRRNDGGEERVDLVHYIPLFTASAYRLMLEKAGFCVRSYSGYDEQPEDGRSHILCFVAQKGGRRIGRLSVALPARDTARAGGCRQERCLRWA